MSTTMASSRSVSGNRVIITENAPDFRCLCGRIEVHTELIMPPLLKAEQLE